MAGAVGIQAGHGRSAVDGPVLARSRQHPESPLEAPDREGSRARNPGSDLLGSGPIGTGGVRKGSRATAPARTRGCLMSACHSFAQQDHLGALVARIKLLQKLHGGSKGRFPAHGDLFDRVLVKEPSADDVTVDCDVHSGKKLSQFKAPMLFVWNSFLGHRSYVNSLGLPRSATQFAPISTCHAHVTGELLFTHRLSGHGDLPRAGIYSQCFAPISNGTGQYSSRRRGKQTRRRCSPTGRGLIAAMPWGRGDRCRSEGVAPSRISARPAIQFLRLARRSPKRGRA